MCEEEESTVREVVMDYAGIYYAETGVNKIYINQVLDDDGTIKLVLVINQNDVGNQFHAMTFGKVLSTTTFYEMMRQAKSIEAEQLVHEGTTNGHIEN